MIGQVLDASGLDATVIGRIDAIDEVLDHPSVLFRDLGPSAREAAWSLLESTNTYDVAAAHATVISRGRGWPVITGDVGRLRRLDPDVEVLLL